MIENKVSVGKSMYPLLEEGDILTITDKFKPKIGDIVLVFRNTNFESHRIIAKKKNLYYTKGDNLFLADDPVDYNQINGKVIAINGEKLSVAVNLLLTIGSICMSFIMGLKPVKKYYLKTKYDRKWQHLKLVLHPGYVLKRINIIKKQIKLREINEIRTIQISPVDGCILDCELCKKPKNISFMSFNKFKKTIDSFQSLQELYLFGWGEPFLNDEIFKMISYAKSKKIHITIHSNLQTLTEKNVRQIVDSQLDTLVVSVDGISQRTYGKYRKNGRISKVFDNLNQIIKTKNSGNYDKPYIILKCVVNKYNKYDLKKLRKFADSLGLLIKFDKINDFSTINDGNKRLRNKYGAKIHKSNQICQFPYSSIFLDSKGNVFPCPYVNEAKFSFGNIFEENIEKIWHNEKFSSARNLMKGKECNLIIPCETCSRYKKVPKKNI